MTTCIKCRRPLKRASADGYGPVCRKTIVPILSGERDLFGFDTSAAAEAALARLAVHIRSAAIEAHLSVYRQFRQAELRYGVRAK